jgi:hypothetical protein
MRRLLVEANVVLSSPSIVTLKMEAVSSSETSVLTTATRRNIPEDTILYRDNVVTLPNKGMWYHYVERRRTWELLSKTVP